MTTDQPSPSPEQVADKPRHVIEGRRVGPDRTTDDYSDALSGRGPLAYEWSDKPHRLVYDLIGEIQYLQADRRAAEARLAEARKQIDGLLKSHAELCEEKKVQARLISRMAMEEKAALADAVAAERALLTEMLEAVESRERAIADTGPPFYPWPPLDIAREKVMAAITPEQKEQALAYRGPDEHGDPAFATPSPSDDEIKSSLDKVIADAKGRHASWSPSKQEFARRVTAAPRASWVRGEMAMGSEGEWLKRAAEQAPSIDAAEAEFFAKMRESDPRDERIAAVEAKADSDDLVWLTQSEIAEQQQKQCEALSNALAAIEERDARIAELEDIRREENLNFARASVRDAARIAALEVALQDLENCCERLAATRSQQVYNAMIDSGQAQVLLDLDRAQSAARAALATGGGHER